MVQGLKCFTYLLSNLATLYNRTRPILHMEGLRGKIMACLRLPGEFVANMAFEF